MMRRDEVISFYDRFGVRQDRQGWYEDAPLARLIAAGQLERAQCVVEFGCGTGRLAARLLSQVLPTAARYVGLDASATMVTLASERLAPWRDRAEARLGDGHPRVPADAKGFPTDGEADRFLCTYVLDLLHEADIRALLDEAARLLCPGGLLCTAGLTPGPGPLSGAVTALWRLAHRLHWPLVGGCRPLRVVQHLPAGRWRVVHHEVVVARGIPSEVLVAARL